MRRSLKRYKTKKYKKRKTYKKSRKMRGGDNIGGNCSDPNFSIYNTNLLKLFPYKGGTKEEDEQFRNEFINNPPSTSITDPVELGRLQKSIQNEEIRNNQNNRFKIDENERQINQQQIQNNFINQARTTPINNNYQPSTNNTNKRFSKFDLGGSKKRRSKRKTTKSKKGGKLTLEDQYKNDEGSQF
jgi:hypothetical protein